MKKSFLLFSFLLAFNFIFSQDYTFTGFIQNEKKSLIPYTLKISIDSFYSISGSSEKVINNLKNISSIEGEYNEKNNTIYYLERSLDKNGFEIDFQGFVGHIVKNIYALPGIYKTSNNKDGYINIICNDFHPNDKMKKSIDASATAQKDTNDLIKYLDSNSKKFAVYKTVKSGDIASFTSTYDTVFLKIYDQLIEDGDIVQLTFNNAIIIKDLVLTKQGHIFTLPIKKGKNVLIVKAMNEGRIDFNTSKLELYNRGNQMFFTNILNKKENATYEITF